MSCKQIVPIRINSSKTSTSVFGLRYVDKSTPSCRTTIGLVILNCQLLVQFVYFFHHTVPSNTFLENSDGTIIKSILLQPSIQSLELMLIQYHGNTDTKFTFLLEFIWYSHLNMNFRLFCNLFTNSS